jgi:hypothetical protein
MPRIGNVCVSVLREESDHTGQLVEALCAAHPHFLPIALDCTGIRNGESYRYASIASIRRSVMPALAEQGLWLQHVYTDTERGEHVVTVLRHKTNEYITSSSLVPAIPDAQERKGVKTLLCRTHVEGMLSVITEEDTDGKQEPGVSPEDAARWKSNLALAEAAVALATDDATLTRYVSVAQERVQSGLLPPGADELIESLCKKRSLALKEKSSANDAGTTGTEESAAAGGAGRSRGGKRSNAGTGA